VRIAESVGGRHRIVAHVGSAHTWAELGLEPVAVHAPRIGPADPAALFDLPATGLPADQVSANSHDLWHVEQSFRMSKTDLAARLLFVRTKNAIEAHLRSRPTCDRVHRGRSHRPEPHRPGRLRRHPSTRPASVRGPAPSLHGTAQGCVGAVAAVPRNRRRHLAGRGHRRHAVPGRAGRRRTR